MPGGRRTGGPWTPERQSRHHNGQDVGDSGSVYLQWGGDNTTPTGDEAVLIDFAALTRDYPNTPQFVIRMRTFWYGEGYSPTENRDGKFTIEFATYLGGTMQQQGLDFINVGGTTQQDVFLPRQSFTNEVGANVDGDDMATLVYTVATKQAVVIAAPAPPMPSGASTSGELSAFAQVVRPSMIVRSSATKG